MTESQSPIHVERWGWYSIGINVVLAAINLSVALASGSLAVRAEMVHNMVDFLTAVAVLIGLKLSTRKTKAFPYGLYKLENVISVFLAGMTFLTAYEIARDALFAQTTLTTVNVWMLLVIIVATAIPLIFSHFELKVGRAANSPALIADATEYRAHVFTTGTVFAALLTQWLAKAGIQNFPLDRVAALVIVVAIGKTGWELLSDGMRVLLDASLDADTLLEIRETIMAEPTVTEIKWVTGRNAGRFRFVEAEIALRVHELEKAETVTQRIEQRIREICPHIDRVLLHAEPVQRTHALYAVPLEDNKDTLSEHFGEAPYFGLLKVRLADGVVEAQQILTNPFVAIEKAKGIEVAEWLVAQKVDEVRLRQELHGKGPLYVLGDAGVEVRQTDTVTLEEVLSEELRINAARSPAVE
ncbi:MAG: cation diffusion facilitator family transporter [Anaerolineae bacterium]|nr:cation diffusion facilitator family transporter [Anaerolineae bacterium]